MKVFKVIMIFGMIFGSMPLVSMEAPPGKKAKAKERKEENPIDTFCNAASTGDMATINRLLASGIPVDARNAQNFTALFKAVANGHCNVVERLLQAGALVNAPNGELFNNWTALHNAAFQGHPKIVNVLLKAGADKNALTGDRRTALSLALQNYHTSVIKLLHVSPAAQAPAAPLLRNNLGTNKEAHPPEPARIPQNDGHAIPTAALRNILICSEKDKEFLDAVMSGNSEAALLALNTGAILDWRSKEGMTALHYAAREGKTNLVEILLALGIEVNIKDSYNHTPLHCTLLFGHADIVRILLTAGADSNAEDCGGSISLHYYVKAKIFDPQLGEILLKAGAKINAQNRAGSTPLHWACDLGNRDAVRFLLEHGADTTLATTEFGFTPLHCAVRQGHLDVVASLLRAKAPKDAKAQDGSTAFELAQKNGHIAIALLLKLAGAKVADKMQQVPQTPETDTEAHLPSPRVNQDQAQGSVEQAQRAQPGVQLPQGPHSSRKRTFLDDGK